MDDKIDERAGRYREQRHTNMRRTIARRLTESKASIPHFYVTVDVAAENLQAQRDRHNAGCGDKVSLNDFLVWHVACALREHPSLNASWQEDAVRYWQDVNVGVAMAAEGGLIVPVVRQAQARDVAEISVAIRQFSLRARERKLVPYDWEGSTFTVSNLGMYGVDAFTAIINPPDVAILAVGAIRDVPVIRGGAVVPGRVVTLTLCADHRVVDGAAAAAFLRTLRQLVEAPIPAQ